MNEVKVVLSGLLYNKTKTHRGYIRISTHGVLQIMKDKQYEQRSSGECIATYAFGTWLSACNVE